MSDHPIVDGDYTITFKRAVHYGWHTTYVLYKDEIIHEKAISHNYSRSVRWAERRIRRHRKAMHRLSRLRV